MKISILSHYINNSTPSYGGIKKINLMCEKSIKGGQSSNSLKIKMNTHASTHVDLPYHFIRKGKRLNDYRPDDWVFNNILIKDLGIIENDIIDEEKFRDLDRDENVDFLILNTGFEKFRGQKSYIYSSPVVRSSLAKFLKSRLPNLRAMGFDFISLSSTRNREEGRKAHKEFLKKDILLIEDMALSAVKDSPDFILASPILVDKADASPVSVWAFYKDFDFSRYQYLFFDFDGVILDSVDIKTHAFRMLYKKYGPDIVRKAVRHHTANGGISRYEKFRLYHKQFLGIDLTDKEVMRLAQKFSGIVFNKVLKAKFIKGALEFLKASRNHNKICFIVSSTPEPEIKKIVRMRNLAGFFKDVKGSPATKERNLKGLIKKYGIDRKKAVFFGDSVNDMKAANLGGIKFVGINYPDAAVSLRDFDKILKEIK